jgi:hypothetical protein
MENVHIHTPRTTPVLALLLMGGYLPQHRKGGHYKNWACMVSYSYSYRYHGIQSHGACPPPPYFRESQRDEPQGAKNRWGRRRPDRPPNKWKNKIIFYGDVFDSTKGYPGEGPVALQNTWISALQQPIKGRAKNKTQRRLRHKRENDMITISFPFPSTPARTKHKRGKKAPTAQPIQQPVSPQKQTSWNEWFLHLLNSSDTSDQGQTVQEPVSSKDAERSKSLYVMTHIRCKSTTAAAFRLWQTNIVVAPKQKYVTFTKEGLAWYSHYATTQCSGGVTLETLPVEALADDNTRPSGRHAYDPKTQSGRLFPSTPASRLHPQPQPRNVKPIGLMNDGLAALQHKEAERSKEKLRLLSTKRGTYENIARSMEAKKWKRDSYGQKHYRPTAEDLLPTDDQRVLDILVDLNILDGQSPRIVIDEEKKARWQEALKDMNHELWYEDDWTGDASYFNPTQRKAPQPPWAEPLYRHKADDAPQPSHASSTKAPIPQQTGIYDDERSADEDLERPSDDDLDTPSDGDLDTPSDEEETSGTAPIARPVYQPMENLLKQASALTPSDSRPARQTKYRDSGPPNIVSRSPHYAAPQAATVAARAHVSSQALPRPDSRGIKPKWVKKTRQRPAQDSTANAKTNDANEHKGPL